MKLNLDSLVYLERNFYSVRKSNRGHSKWTRLTLPIHSALLLIRAISSQTIRGTGSMIAGVLTYDPTKVLSGLHDYVSVLAQVVALPIIGVIAPFSPDTAGGALGWILSRYSYETSPSNRGNDLARAFVNESEYMIGKEITCLVRGILVGIPVSIIDSATVGLSSILKGKICSGLGRMLDGFVYQPLSNIFESHLGFDHAVYSRITKVATNEMLYRR